MRFSQQWKGRYVLSLVYTHNAMHMFLTFYRSTLDFSGCGFILLLVFLSVGTYPTSWSNQLPKLSDHGKLCSENNSWEPERKMLRTSRLLIKVSVAEPGTSLLRQEDRSSYQNRFASSRSCWSCDVLASILRKRRWYEPAPGAWLQHSLPETPRTSRGTFPMETAGWLWPGYTCSWLWTISAYHTSGFLPFLPMTLSMLL